MRWKKGKSKFKVGDCVVVKDGVIDPDLGSDLGGWQGRITEIFTDGSTICVEWDSITLENTPGSVIAECEELGLDWSRMYLDATKLEATTPRDEPSEAKQKIVQIKRQHAWDHLGPEGKNISKVLAGISPENERAAIKAWHRHLNKMLTFPFEAKIVEHQDRGPFQTGDRVIVKSIAFADDSLGLIVMAKHKRRHYQGPLFELEVLDKTSANYDLVAEYAVWFANR